MAEFAELAGLEIKMIEDFRERRVGEAWIAGFDVFARKQWEDFDYKLPGGEALSEVQGRNIRALNAVLKAFDQLL